MSDMEPVIVNLDIRKIPLTDFMKALGQEHPVAADGNLRIYKAPYDANGEPTMVINMELKRRCFISEMYFVYWRRC